MHARVSGCMQAQVDAYKRQWMQTQVEHTGVSENASVHMRICMRIGTLGTAHWRYILHHQI